MPVVAIRTELKCKICASEHREAVDALLGQWAEKKLVGGERITHNTILAAMSEMGFENPNPTNIKGHWKNHCEFVTAQQLADRERADKLDIVRRLEQAQEAADIEGDLDKLWNLGMSEVEKRIANGERSGVTVDHLMKISAEKTRRGLNEAQADLLKAIGGGIEAALGQPPEIPALEEAIEDAEVEEVA
jgi:hypothetical protein